MQPVAYQIIAENNKNYTLALRKHVIKLNNIIFRPEIFKLESIYFRD